MFLRIFCVLSIKVAFFGGSLSQRLDLLRFFMDVFAFVWLRFFESKNATVPLDLFLVDEHFLFVESVNFLFSSPVFSELHLARP